MSEVMHLTVSFHGVIDWNHDNFHLLCLNINMFLSDVQCPNKAEANLSFKCSVVEFDWPKKPSSQSPDGCYSPDSNSTLPTFQTALLHHKKDILCHRSIDTCGIEISSYAKPNLHGFQSPETENLLLSVATLAFEHPCQIIVAPTVQLWGKGHCMHDCSSKQCGEVPLWEYWLYTALLVWWKQETSKISLILDAKAPHCNTQKWHFHCQMLFEHGLNHRTTLWE